jgi:hypothetical protein
MAMHLDGNDEKENWADLFRECEIRAAQTVDLTRVRVMRYRFSFHGGKAHPDPKWGCRQLRKASISCVADKLQILHQYYTPFLLFCQETISTKMENMG